MFKDLGISVAGLFLIWLIGLGEIAWLGFVGLWSVLLAKRMFPKWVSAIPPAIGLAIIALHAAGFKFYGAPITRDNRPLVEHAWQLDHLEAPNILVAIDGSRHPVPDVEFSSGFEKIPADLVAKSFDRRGEPVRFAKDGESPSGYAAERRIEYWCGNTWFPSFFPRRLPTHERVDLALVLSRSAYVTSLKPTR